MSGVPKCPKCGGFMWWRNYPNGRREYYCKWCKLEGSPITRIPATLEARGR